LLDETFALVETFALGACVALNKYKIPVISKIPPFTAKGI
jgi:hypothetical protein